MSVTGDEEQRCAQRDRLPAERPEHEAPLPRAAGAGGASVLDPSTLTR